MKSTSPAWILRRVRWSETSLIVTAYSLDRGRISLMARGALRPGGRMQGALELLSCAELTASVREGREMDTLTDASVLEAGGALRADPLLFAHASLLAEWVMGLFLGAESSREVFHVIGRAFSAYPGARTPWAVTCASVEELIRLAGLGMEVDNCVRCGSPAAPAAGWSTEAGGVLCAGCSAGLPPASGGLLEFIRTCRRGGFEAACRTGLWKGGFRQCHDFLRDFARAHNQSGLWLHSLGVLEELEDGLG